MSTCIRIALPALFLLHVLVLFAFFSINVIADHHHSNGRGCMDKEREALLKFKNSVVDPYGTLSSWAGDDCCTWIGVVCHNITGPVIELNLSGADFVGEVPPHMGNLSNLRVLDLSFNRNMTIGNIGWLSHLSSLLYLDLSSVGISEKAPWLETVNKLSSLSRLRLRQCNLENVYASHPRVNFTNLKVLDLSLNNFHRYALPDWMSHLTNLERLDASQSDFTGPIPSYLGKMSALQRLDLSDNKFEGSVPESLWQLSGLVDLDISDNALEGNITELHFSNLAKLEVLFMSGNSFKFNISSTWVPPFQLKIINLSFCSMEYSSFPYWLRNQENIHVIALSKANLHGSAPEWFWKILSNATYIDLSNNKISGELPVFSSRLEYLDLSNNSFSGSLPNIWEKDSFLWNLDLSNNGFSGTIPSSFGNLTRLEYLILENNHLSGQLRLPAMRALTFLHLKSNRFSGKIPEWIFGKVSKDESTLSLMDLSNNELSGTIPSSIGNLIDLVSLYLGNNTLSGHLPLSMKNLKNLWLIDLHNNRLSGKIPSWMGENLSNLRFLKLRSNLFHGEVPGQLSQLASLQILDVANNTLSGSIPKSFRNFKAMTNTNNYNPLLPAHGYDESMWIVTKGRESFYEDLWENKRKDLDLSMNKFSGNIPEELTELKGLQSLNLSGNFLQGPIPDKIGELRKLESLDLSRNRLSGVIPPSLSAITFLEYLNVSNNNLSGKIPFTGQLTTFGNSSYFGNEKLCGPPLSKMCPGDLETPQTHRDPDDHISRSQEEEGDEIEPWTLYIVTGLGFIGGICSMFGVLIANKSWRDRFYRFSDDMFERFIVVVILWRIRIKRMLLK